MDVYLEIGEKRIFAVAVKWPGWARAAKTETDALQDLASYVLRYAPVAMAAGHPLPGRVTNALNVVERLPGDATTDFGAPGAIPSADHAPMTGPHARRLADFYDAACALLDRTVEQAPAQLRKGPRGGGRDRDKIVQHLLGAEQSYARKLGLKLEEPAFDDPDAIAAFRNEIRRALRYGHVAEPTTETRWPPRYAARRMVWHLLDHVWEIQDRHP